MNRKWSRYVLIGIVVFDLCLLAGRTGFRFDAGNPTAPWGEGPTVQAGVFDPVAARAKTTGNLTAATILLLTAVTLL